MTTVAALERLRYSRDLDHPLNHYLQFLCFSLLSFKISRALLLLLRLLLTGDEPEADNESDEDDEESCLYSASSLPSSSF